MASAAIQGLEFRVKHVDGRTETLVVDSDRALIGSGAHCEIRLPIAQAAVEHVAITQAGGGVHAEALALDRPPTLGGVGFTQTPLPPGSTIKVGDEEITISVVTIEDNPNVIKKKTQKTSTMTYVLAIVAIPLALYVIFMDDDPNAAPQRPADVVALWDAPIDACPQSAPDLAFAAALEKKVLGDSKRERRPFHVQDGVAAVPLYEAAAACFRVAQQPEAAADAAENAEDLRRVVGADYHAHQVRLDHALAVGDVLTAQKEVVALREFTEGRVGPYVVWLSNLDRALQLQAAKLKKS